MSDVEIIKLCAEAMGYSINSYQTRPGIVLTVTPPSRDPQSLSSSFDYRPLHDDTQAMALMKKFGLHPVPEWDEGSSWTVFGGGYSAMSDDLNRAICECVAKMQAEKKTASNLDRR